MVDPSYSMPLVNWEPTASFRGTVLPPSASPDAGTLIQLPCINQDWLMLLLGCVQQLWNPATYDSSLTDIQRADAIAEATKLSRMLGASLEAGCVNPLIDLRLEGCKLVAVPATGPAFNVLDFSSDTCSCTNQCIIAPVPPIVPPDHSTQRACNIAGFLAAEVIQKTVQAVVSYEQSRAALAQFSATIMQDFNYLFPITNAAVQAFNSFFQDYISGVVAHFTAAGGDESLWSSVTCAIFSAIADTGYITEANYPTLVANVCSISYTYADVVLAICSLVTELGVNNMQQMQNVGATDDVDCSACDISWCAYFDLTADQGPFEPNPVEPSQTWVSGIGYPGYTSGVGAASVAVALFYSIPIELTEAQYFFTRLHDNTTGSPDNVNFQEPVGTVVAATDSGDTSGFLGTKWDSLGLAHTGQNLFINLNSASESDPETLCLKAVQLRGTGVCPFITCGNCIVGP